MERDERGKIRKVISEGEVRLPIALIIGEEIARELAERVAESVPKSERLVTRTLDRRGFEITSMTELIYSNRPGRLREFSMVSNTDRFTVVMMVDGARRIDRRFSELVEMSEFMETIDAYNADGKYVFRVSDVKWTREFSLIIIPERVTVKVDNALAFWDEAV
jgi:hypothetical protein